MPDQPLKDRIIKMKWQPRPRVCVIPTCGKTYNALSPAAKYCSPECVQVALKEAVERQRQRRIKAREEKPKNSKPSAGDGLA